MRGVVKKDLVGDTSGHEAGALPIIQSSLRIALVSGYTWGAGALAAAFMACGGMAAWVVLPVSLIVIFAIALIVNGTRLVIQGGGPERPLHLPEADLFSDGAVQSLAKRLTAARTRLERVVRDSPRGASFDLAQVQQTTSDIERRVVVLAARAEYVASFLASMSVAEINGALDRARGRAAAGDDRARMYGPLVATYESHLHTVHALEAEKERLLAAAEQLVGTLEAFPANLTHLQCLRLTVADGDAFRDSIESAGRVRQSLDALEEALEEASKAERGVTN